MQRQVGRRATPWVVSSLCAVLAWSCDGCDRRVADPPAIELRFSSASDEGVATLAETGRVEFPPTPMGTTEPPVRKLTVTNLGRSAVTIIGIARRAGDSVRIAAGGDAAAVFHVQFAGEVSLAAGQSLELDVAFSPPVTPGARFVDHQATLSVAVGDGKDATVELVGRAIADTCALPQVLDFGGVEIGGTGRASVVFDNQTPAPADAFAGPVTAAVEGSVFTYESDSAAGEFVVQAGTQRSVRLQFRPTEQRDYLATVKLRRARGCPLQTVRLLGTGLADCLSFVAAPTKSATGATLDFGYVPPGASTPGTVTFRNQCTMPVELSAIDTTANAFRVTQASATDRMRLTVPPGSRAASGALQPGTATAQLAFVPVSLGTARATLRGNTSLQRMPAFAVPLSGVGGGPDIELRPAQGLNFGVVSFFAGAAPHPSTARRLQIVNAGTPATPPVAEANLLLGRGGAGAPYWDVEVIQGEREELCLGVFDEATAACGVGGVEALPTTGAGAYDPSWGLQASAGRAVLDVAVHLTPRSAGPKEFVVTVHSNDFDEPAVRYTIRANAQPRPPCDYTIEPATVDFGVVNAPSTKDLAFKLRNVGAQPCFFSALELDQGSDPTFTLPDGPVDELELAAGAERLVTVRAWPQRANDQSAPPEHLQGAVVFNASSLSAPRGRVTLRAVLSVSCLVLAPADLDFGTVQVGCGSPERTIQLHNTCSSPVTVTGYRWLSASRVQPGVGSCAQAGGCPEFTEVTAPAPGVLASGSMRSYGVRYRPYDLGSDVGSLAFTVQQGAATVDYVAVVRGRGDTTGRNEDVFRQQERRSADLLFVVDNSCSMDSEQAALAASFQSFLRYAVANQIDFQIGVTTSDNSVGGEQGRLVTSPSGEKLFRPSTTGLHEQFAATVNVGTQGSGEETCLAPATAALTNPLVSDPRTNGGLVRPDAVLAVICVTDELEQAPLPNSHYMVQLLNVKGTHRPQAFSYSVIGPFTPNAPCTPDYDPELTGRHSQAVAAGRGVKEDICSPNWAPALERLAPVAFGLRREFPLTARPGPTAEVQVLVDGVEVPPQAGGTSAWAYEPASNQVVFDANWVPEPGHVISVRYSVECFP